jgi:hypothetical protein
MWPRAVLAFYTAPKATPFGAADIGIELRYTAIVDFLLISLAVKSQAF